MTELKSPPPVRRIVVKESTPVAPPKRRAGRAAAAKSTASDLLSAPRKRPAKKGKVTDRMQTMDFSVAYAGKPAVKEVNLKVSQGEVLALIGPSGCGKTTLLRSLNRLVEQTPTATTTGMVTLDGRETHELDVTDLRRKVGMVFQQPNPFPMSIFDNVAYGIRERGSRRPGKRALEPKVIEALERCGLYDEVKDNLSHPALRLSGGQQQRLCIGRSLAVNPEVLLLDEPCSALDPRSTTIIEELIMKLRDEVAIVIVTHNLQQAYRVADRVAFMYLGDLVEYGPADQLFGSPRNKRTRDYVSGAFG
ncbi:MAG: phosphate transport system ATP-binding protein [Solirubrobacterales bacterium]|jgi:phosphate transport system ATP-binding protein|nr:phosphate transport system ATP-binding protein [Solirubrobacterales bacterium]